VPQNLGFRMFKASAAARASSSSRCRRRSRRPRRCVRVPASAATLVASSGGAGSTACLSLERSHGGGRTRQPTSRK
jgi:hypothetical protein